MDVGTVVWLLFFALVAYALLAKAAELLLDIASWARDAFCRQPKAASAGEPEQDDAFPWTDAQSVHFGQDGEPEDDDEWASQPWVAPLPPEGMACPVCDGPLLPVLYGFPSPEMFQASEDGMIILGGCCPGDERYRCPRCADGWSPRSSRASSQNDQASR
jgi:hypothetical protein